MQELVDDIEGLIIKEKYSPFAALEVLKKRYEVPFGWRTFYNYICKEIFSNLGKNIYLIRKSIKEWKGKRNGLDERRKKHRGTL